MITVLASIVGALLGSMMSVIVARWPALEGFATGRSRCPHCMHALSWQDLVPVVSWLVSGGACRYCKAPISLRYPAYELWAFVLGLPSGVAGQFGRKAAGPSSGGSAVPGATLPAVLIPAGSTAKDSTGAVTIKTRANVTTDGPPNLRTVVTRR
jgi:leader peptidase (prepilin peptidase)/N-methyltransferase